jgi:hypothetical protein
MTKIQTERILNKIAPTDVKEDLLCTEPHDWFSAPHTLDANDEYTYVNVCKNCGFIPSLNVMATQEGLKHIEKNKKYLETEERIRTGFIESEKEDIKKGFEEELKSGLDFHKLERVYLAGQNMKQRYILYKLCAIDKAISESESANERRN